MLPLMVLKPSCSARPPFMPMEYPLPLMEREVPVVMYAGKALPRMTPPPPGTCRERLPELVRMGWENPVRMGMLGVVRMKPGSLRVWAGAEPAAAVTTPRTIAIRYRM
jgi:hypothetical protein